jgi:ABC-type dipeptide/oligopeptide/nickel transport system permease component
MLNYIIRRLLLMIPTLIGITLVAFLVMAWAPGGVGGNLRMAEGNMRPDQRAAIEKYLNHRFGRDKPLPIQYLHWLNQVSPIGFRTSDDNGDLHHFGLKAPDLGESWLRGQPVMRVIAEALPPTLLLNLITAPIVYVISILSGIYAARHRGKFFDVGSGTLFLALWSMPTMWIGVMLLGFFASKDYHQYFPTGDLHNTTAMTEQFLPHRSASGFQAGWLLDTVWHLTLPVICLTIGAFAFLSKLMRASMLENISADFARTARAKGLGERVVLFRHVLRNSLLPMITVAAGILPGLLGGSLIVEKIFSIKGMGPLMIDAIFQKDQELVMSETLVVGLVGLISLLIADLCYVIADPRVTYE